MYTPALIKVDLILGLNTMYPVNRPIFSLKQ